MGEVTQPPFSRIAVVGLGLIGGSIAFAARRAWPSVHVVAIDREPVLKEALARRAIDAAAADLAAVGDVDLIVLTGEEQVRICSQSCKARGL
jgi:prephenate dehydrogenase